VPIETLSGRDVPELMARARALLGADAVMLSMVRSPRGFELRAADPATATRIPGLAASVPAGPAAPLPSGRGGPVVLALIGPTGAGKTTTVAKLALHERALGGRATGLLCLDTFRAGAVEQLRLWASSRRLPLEVAHTPADAARAMRRLARCEVVLVDTAGRGPARQAEHAATASLLRAIAPAEVHLVLPAGSSTPTLVRVLAAHQDLGVTHILPSKLDEHPGDRAALELAAERALPIRWRAVGQTVPDDLETAIAAPAPGFERRLLGVA
jgi:flagellar biosynthesis protein FlhF